jgi:hypothetical protein
MKFHRSLLGSASSLALNIVLAGSFAAVLPSQASAGVCPTLSTDTTLSGAVSNCYQWAGGNITADASANLTTTATQMFTTTSSANVGTFVNNGTITGRADVFYNIDGTITGITNNTTITVNHFGSRDVFNDSTGTIATIDNEGTMSAYGDGSVAIRNYGTITTLTNGKDHTISASGSSVAGVDNSGTITTLTNGGTISASGSSTTVGVNNIGTITTLTNNGTIEASSTSDSYGIGNFGTITTLTNTGIISGGNSGIFNKGGHIHSIDNSGQINGTWAIYNDNGTIDLITNEAHGVIASIGVGIGLYNERGTITSLSNAGMISGGGAGIYNIDNGTITTITNLHGGTIQSTASYSGSYGIYNEATIGTITNGGTITASGTSGMAEGIYNAGTIGTITNTGTISGSGYAIYSPGTITNPIGNSGTIDGNIYTAGDLTFTGGSNSAFGTLTGGTITAPNLTFDGAAYQKLDDDVVVGGGSGILTNNGAVKVTAAHTIGGNYTQASTASLIVGVADSSHYGSLTISGDATMTGAKINITPTSGSLTNGETLTVVRDQGVADYSGITATVNQPGFTASVSSAVDGLYDDLIVALRGVSYSAVGASVGGGNAGHVGGALDTLRNAGSAAFNPIFTALDNLGGQSTQAEGNAVNQLAPNQLSPQLASGNMSANQAGQMISQHQEGLLSQNGTGDIGKAAGSTYQSGSFWAQMSGGVANKDSTATTGGYSQNFYGMTFGADAFLDKDAIAGGAVSWITRVTGFSRDKNANGSRRQGVQLIADHGCCDVSESVEDGAMLGQAQGREFLDVADDSFSDIAAI